MRTLNQLLAGASLSLALFACDTTGSITAADETTTTASATIGNNGNGFGNHEPIGVTSAAPGLQTMHAEFWAVQGKQRSVTIRYLPAPGEDEGKKFLVFTVSNKTQLVSPAGRVLARGDSLLIAVDVEPGKLEARFSPHGLVFAGSAPAVLEVSFFYGDTRGKPTDGLGIWYYPVGGDSAEPVYSSVDARGWMVRGLISHFSNYAVAY